MHWLGLLLLTVLMTAVTCDQPSAVIVTFKTPDAAAELTLTAQTAKDQALHRIAETSQSDVISLLQDKSNMTFHQLWAFNKLIIQNPTPDFLRSLHQRPEVASITIDEPLSSPTSRPSKRSLDSSCSDGSWGLENIQVKGAWNAGYKGKGAVVGVIESGACAQHSALKSNFRSDGYGWYDVIDKSESPRDYGHSGTFVTAIAVGSVGVAPEAQWAHCRAFQGDMPTNETVKLQNLLKCLHWMYCPTKPDGSEENCEKRPKIVTSSLTLNKNTDDFKDIFKRMTEAGMILVFPTTSSDDKKTCESIKSPGDYDSVITVGCINKNNSVIDSSARGTVVDQDLIKPDFVAPCTDILSAVPGEDSECEENTVAVSGAAHVAGIAALYVSKNASVTMEDIRKGLRAAAADVAIAGDFCGGLEDNISPNFISGFGRVIVDDNLAH